MPNTDFVFPGFQNHISQFFKCLVVDNYFADVTLVSDDNFQIKAHKVVLSSFSTFFRNLFIENSHSHPMLFIKGASQKALSKILDFIYTGKTDVPEDELQMFLEFTKYFEIHGFVESTTQNQSALTAMNTNDEVNIVQKNIISSEEMKASCDEVVEESSFPQESIVVNRIKVIVKTSKKDKRTDGPKVYCDQCTYKTGYNSDLKKHIESVHKGIKHECNLCHYIANSKQRVEEHKNKRHYLPMLD